MYTPDRWVIVDILETQTRKVFGSFYGGYARGDEWRLNSGVVNVEEHPTYYLFHGVSGSVYKCNKASYGVYGWGRLMLDALVSRMKEAGYTVDVLKNYEYSEE